MRDQINVYFRDFRKNPLTFSKVVYTFPNADAELRLRCFQKMEEKYGKNPPKQISDRLEQELRTSRMMPRRIYFSLDCACSKEEMSNSTHLGGSRRPNTSQTCSTRYAGMRRSRMQRRISGRPPKRCGRSAPQETGMIHAP